MMAKKTSQTIFEMDLDKFKGNVEKKTANDAPMARLEYLQWIQIGMLWRIGRVLIGLDSPTAKMGDVPEAVDTDKE